MYRFEISEIDDAMNAIKDNLIKDLSSSIHQPKNKINNKSNDSVRVKLNT